MAALDGLKGGICAPEEEADGMETDQEDWLWLRGKQSTVEEHLQKQERSPNSVS